MHTPCERKTVVAAIRVRITHADDLYFRFVEQAAEFAKTLRAHADVGGHDFVVRSDVSRSPQNVMWNDGNRAACDGGINKIQ